MKATITVSGKLIIGALLMWFGFWNVHIEMMRASGPSNVTVFVFLGLGLLGALIFPSMGDWIVAAARKGIDTARYGRRAYDNTPETPAPGDPK
jgi:hypothetical protein